MTITEFLEARIAEDEDRARDFEQDHALAINGSYSNWDACYGAPASWKAVERIGFLPARIAAECAAKRAVVGRYEEFYATRRANWMNPNYAGAMEELQWALQALTAVYADHPDYLPEWAL